jgi:hypothetical protein
VTGQFWWRNDPDGSLFLYYDDGTSKQFVPAVSYVGNPSGPAGGDLAGSTYPNPVIAALAVTKAKLAAGATSTVVATAAPGLFASGPTGTWKTVVTSPAVTMATGQLVIVFPAVGLTYTGPASGGTVYTRIARDAGAVTVLQQRVDLGAASGTTDSWIVPVYTVVDTTAAAGSHTWSLDVQVAIGTGSIATPNDNAGELLALLLS